MKTMKYTSFGLSDVTLTDGYLVNAFNKELAYLTSFDTDRLLAGFRETAGLDMKGAVRYDGWENALIGGHTMGHYLTACVQAYESANCAEKDREKLYEIISSIILGLKECSDATGTGFIFGATLADKDNIEAQFDNIEQGKADIFTQAWVPWYTMHKIFEGLLVAAQMQGVKTRELAAAALETVSKLGDWVYRRTSSWSNETHKKVLAIEYGGMNDALFELYLLTGSEKHKAAACAFDEIPLFEKVYAASAGDNVLNNCHANTTIPKFMGALKHYVACPEDEIYLEYAKAFWELVTKTHSYVTGGNSEWEHFGEDNVLDAERTNANCETCNSYNMLKLTKLLFMLTGDEKYADWYENTFINSILSSQNPESGMTTYFQAMKSGYFKVFGNEFSDFWCCVGTGMENFSKLGESFWYRESDTILVNNYFSSTLSLKDMDVKIEQRTDLLKSDVARLKIHGAFAAKLALRLPEWLAAPAELMINGISCCYKIHKLGESGKGYALVEGLKDGDEVSFRLPMQINAFNLPDGKNTYAFKYGPWLLSALLGDEAMIKTKTGVDVDIADKPVFEIKRLPSADETVRVSDESVESFVKDINSHMLRRENADRLEFELKGTDSQLVYTAHFAQYKERYAIYLQFTA